jgi:hypothetical protein
LLLALTSLPHMPWNGPRRPGHRQAGHLSFYAVLTYLYVLMAQRQGQGAQNPAEVLLLMLLLPIFDEAHQLFSPGREFSLLDLAADLIGMALCCCSALRPCAAHPTACSAKRRYEPKSILKHSAGRHLEMEVCGSLLERVANLADFRGDSHLHSARPRHPGALVQAGHPIFGEHLAGRLPACT